MKVESFSDKCKICGRLLNFEHDDSGETWVIKHYYPEGLNNLYMKGGLEKDGCPECQKKITEWLAKEEEFKKYYKKVEEMENKNNVRPSHYRDCSLECWDVMRLLYGKKALLHFCLLNVFKYLWRCDCKNGQEDLEKAEMYLRKAEELTDGETETHELRGLLEKKREEIEEDDNV